MILSKIKVGGKSLKSGSSLTPMFEKADTNGTGYLDFE